MTHVDDTNSAYAAPGNQGRPVEMSASPKASYLPHLDGLRAVALLGVLLFHFEVRPFKGGFIGVDVFLTLSGYLITRNLLNDAANRCLCLRTFYIRRFFRLYPASTVTTLLTTLAAYALFAPNLAKEVCQSALASQLFASNVFFYTTANYFEPKSLLRPLLHTWSLSLEEHFYFLWAPFLKVILSMPNTTTQLSLIATLALTSFLFACYTFRYDYSLTFYLLPARAFQFMIGALLAFLQQMRRRPADSAGHGAAVSAAAADDADPEAGYETPKGKFLIDGAGGKSVGDIGQVSKPRAISSNWVSILALLLLLASYALLPKSPGPYLTLPVAIATAAIIQTGDSMLSSFLSRAPIVWIGTLTYSAYLVHWPIWVYTRYIVTILDVDGLWRPNPAAVTVVTIAAAFLLRTLVEQPFRKGNRRAQVIVTLLFFLTVGFAAAGVRTRGFMFRQSWADNGTAKFKKFLMSNDLAVFPLDACMRYENFLSVGTIKTKVSCVTGSKQVEPLDNILFVGNSFASMLLPALDVIGRRRGIRVAMWFAYRCDIRARGRVDSVNDLGKYECRRAVEAIWKRIEEMPPNSTVVFSTFWGFHSREKACAELAEIDSELQALGYNGVVFPEPPGVHPRYERFYSCMDCMKLPAGRALRWWGALRKWSSVSSCGTDVRAGLEPHPAIGQYEGWYHSCGNLGRLKVLALEDRICEHVDERDGFTWVQTAKRCRFPNSTVVPLRNDDLGYERALFHMSSYGAYQMVDMLDEMLAPYLPALG